MTESRAPRRRMVVHLNDARPIWGLPGWAVEAIRAAVPVEWEVIMVEALADGRGDGGAPAAEVVEALRGAEVYLGWGFPRELWEAGGRTLRWVHSASAGVGGALYPEMRAAPLLLTNSAGIHADPIGESVLAMILHFARGLDFAVRAQAEGRWDKAPFEAADTPAREVAGTTVGIVGFGGIGRAVAARARALGMRVVAVRRSPGAEEGVEVLHGPEGLRALLPRSDHLVVAAPETEQTRGLIGAAELALLPPGAVLVNVSRGGVVDEEALAEALAAGRLRGAALDVFRQEPLPAHSPLWRLPNVLITPHVTGTTRRFWEREVELIRDNLRRYLAGEPLRNTVDKSRGY